MLVDGATIWSSATSLGTILLWVVLPPLLIWAAWLVARPSPAMTRAEEGGHGPRASLGAGGMGEVPVRERTAERRER